MSCPCSIQLMPLIEDSDEGWYVVIGDCRVAGPFSEVEASAVLDRMLRG